MSKAYRKKFGRLSVLCLVVVAAVAGFVKTRAAAPDWWSNPNVLNGSDPADEAVALSGQGKHIAYAAYLEFEDEFSSAGGAGSDIENLVGSFTEQNNGSPLLLGQLKSLAAPFYRRLHQLGVKTPSRDPSVEELDFSYPWPGDSEHDHSPALLGQVKYVFSFETRADSDSDGLRDWWESGVIAASNGAMSSLEDVNPDDDLDGDFRDNLYEFTHGTDALVAESASQYVAIDWIQNTNSAAASVSSPFGSSNEKSSGGNYWNGGGRSAKTMAGDGSFVFRFGDVAKHGMCGLSSVNFGSHYFDIDYAFYCVANGTLRIYENGKYRKSLGGFTATDLLEIRRIGTVVKYFRNDILVHTSTLVGDRPLMADCSLYSLGESISHCGGSGFGDGDADFDSLPDAWEQQYTTDVGQFDHRADPDGDFRSTMTEYALGSDPNVADESPLLPVAWEELVGVGSGIQPGHRSSWLTRVFSSSGWNAAARSVGWFQGDGVVRFRPKGPVEDSHAMMGVSRVSNSLSYAEIEYAIYFSKGHAYRYESGANKGGMSSANATDHFEIRRTGDTVTYHKNGSLLATSAVTTTEPLLVDCSIYSPGFGFEYIGAVGLDDGDLDSDGDGLPNGWEVANGFDPNDDGSGNPDFGPDGNPDGDRWTNIREFEDGTDPSVLDDVPGHVISFYNGTFHVLDLDLAHLGDFPGGSVDPNAILVDDWRGGFFEAFRNSSGALEVRSHEHPGVATTFEHILQVDRVTAGTRVGRILYLVFRDAGNNYLISFDAEAATWGTEALLVDEGGLVESPGITTDYVPGLSYLSSTGELWATYYSGEAASFDSTGANLGQREQYRYWNVGFGNVREVVRHNHNHLASIDYNYNGRLAYWTPQGGSGTTIANPLSDTLGGFYGLTKMTDGRYIAYSSYADILVSVTPEGVTEQHDYPVGIHGSASGKLVEVSAQFFGGSQDDSDGDGIPDGWEIANGLDPFSDDSEGDGDADDLTNLKEFELSTDPSLADSDGDGMTDGWEAAYSLQPTDGSDAAIDADQDNLSNLKEFQIGTNPNDKDTDDDYVPDDVEYYGV